LHPGLAGTFANVGITGPLANIGFQWSFGFDIRWVNSRLRGANVKSTPTVAFAAGLEGRQISSDISF
jgi:hypothetical protein